MMEKSKYRALRRHHAARVKNNRRFYWGHGRDLAESPAQWGKVSATPALCSCWMCGNPRKYYGDRTIQELRALQAVDDKE